MFQVLFVLLFWYLRVIHALDRGDPCDIDENTSGVCRYINNCEYAQKKIYNDKVMQGVEICSWESKTAIVCCPESDVNYRTGTYSLHFENYVDGVITNENTVCQYNGDLPMICCPKAPEYPAPPEPTGCESLSRIKTLVFDNNAHEVAWQKCVQTRRYAHNCQVNEHGVKDYFCNKIYDLQRISTEDPAGSAAGQQEFPHMAVLGCNNQQGIHDTGDSDSDIVWIGGGSLISDRYILTAAHVLRENTYGPVRYALLGVLNKNDVRNGDLYYIIHRKPYKTYVSTEQHDDIALLELNRRVMFSEYIYPICLPVPGIEYDGTQRIVAGWGQTGAGKTNSDILLKAYINEVEFTDCEKYLKAKNFSWDNNTMICARGLKPVLTQYPDSCKGDSGGPLMARIVNKDLTCSYVIVGIVSWGPNCGQGEPGAYTRVAPYINWIVDNVWPKKTVKRKMWKQLPVFN